MNIIISPLYMESCAKYKNKLCTLEKCAGLVEVIGIVAREAVDCLEEQGVGKE